MDKDKKIFYHEQKLNFLNSVLKGNKSKAISIINTLLSKNIEIKEIYMYIFQESQYELGRLWNKGQISVGQEHLATAITQFVMSSLYHKIFDDFTEMSSRKNCNFLGTCASSELHEFGIRMITDLIQMEGFNTFYLGAIVPYEDVVKAIIEYNINIVGISVAIKSHIEEANTLIDMIRRNESIKNIHIMIGGYAFHDNDLWKKLEADYYTKNAEEAIKVAREIAQKRQCVVY